MQADVESAEKNLTSAFYLKTSDLSSNRSQKATMIITLSTTNVTSIILDQTHKAAYTMKQQAVR